MLAKLSFRNAKRQAHDYIIYFVTLTAIFSLIHGLNSLLFAEDDIFPLDDSTFILPMILISSLLFSISLWLTSYMTNFILKRRSKEISIYITLGMEPYQISKVFTLENFYISIFALILSFLCGSFVYQVLKAVSFNLLGKPYSLTFHFSLYPFVITFLYFLFTFLFSSFRSIKIIQKSQPQDLLQYDSPHKIPSSVLILRAKLLFPASIICITLSAIFFLLQPLSESANFTFGTLFSILFIYLFFHYFPAWIFDWLEKGSWKYHSVRLLVLRAFTARINDMSNSFAFLTSSFTVSLSLIAVVAISIFTFNYRLSLVPFTFSIITSQNQNHLADYDIYIKEKYPNSHSSSLSHFHNSIVQRRSLFFFYLFHLLSLLRRALFCAFQKTSFLFLCFYNSIYSFIWYLFCNLFYFIAERNHFYRLRRKTSMSAKKSKTFFKTLTAILVLLLFFGGYYIYSSGIFGASVTENISEHSITDEERLIEYEEYGITYDESSQSYLYQDSLIKNLRDGDFLYTNAAGSIKLIIQRDDNGHIQSIDVE